MTFNFLLFRSDQSQSSSSNRVDKTFEHNIPNAGSGRGQHGQDKSGRSFGPERGGGGSFGPDRSFGTDRFPPGYNPGRLAFIGGQ